MIFKKSLKILKKKFLILFSLDLTFFVLFFFFLIYVRNKIQGYMTLIQQYAPQLTQLQSALEEPNQIALLQLEQTLSAISPVIQKALVFIYFIAPFALFLLFCFFQSLIWKIISKEKFKIKKIFKNFRNHFLKFSALTLPVFVILILAISLIFKKLYYFINLGWEFFSLVLLVFILFYFIFICYTLLWKHKTLRATLKKAIFIQKKFHILVPLFLLFFFIILVLLILFSNIFIMWISRTIILSSLLYSLFAFLIVLAIAIWYKILIYLVLEKY